MDDQGRWPEAVVSPKLTGTGLADSIRERMSTWGYEPEDSFGFCPNFEHRSIYFAWRKLN